MALLGTLFGGAISFGTTFYFHRRERERLQKQETEELVRNLFALYLSTSHTLSDVAAIRREYAAFLPPNERPNEVASQMLPLLGPAKAIFEFEPNHLSYVRGSEAKGLVDKLSNLANLRNLVIALSEHYNTNKTRFSHEVAQYSRIGQDQVMHIELNSEKHQKLILERRELNKRAATILDLLEQFDEFSVEVIEQFNLFTKNHENASVQGFQIVMRNLDE